MDDLEALLHRAASAAAEYRAGLADRPVRAAAGTDALGQAFGGALPDAPTPAADVVDALVAAADAGLVSTAGPRFFGFVIGGSLDAAVAAEVLAAGWDQCAFNASLSPAAVAAEEAAGTWLKDLLGIPATASVGFVTGAQAANTVGLAAARHAVLADAGWDVERRGLLGAPPSGCSPATSATPRSTGRCACSASAPTPSNRCPPAPTGRSTPQPSATRWPAAGPGPRSSPSRRAT